MKKYAYVTLFLLQSFMLIQAYEECHLFKNREWEFLEYHFIINPQEGWLTTLAKIGGTGAIATIAGKIAHTIALPYEKASTNPNNKGLAFGIGAMTFVGSGILSAIVIQYVHAAYVRYNIVQDFIIAWPTYKEYTPAEFHQWFEHAYMLYTQDPESKALKAIIKKTYDIMIEAIHNHFPDKYIPKIVHHYGSHTHLDLTPLLQSIFSNK